MADTTSGATASGSLKVWCLATTNPRDVPEEQERGTGGEEEMEDGDGEEGEMKDEDAEGRELDTGLLIEKSSTVKGDIDSESPLSPSGASDSDSDSDSDSSSDADSGDETESHGPLLLTSAIHDAQLSADGSTIFTADYNRTFSVYPVYPVEKSHQGPRLLEPYGQAKSPNPIWAFASNPFFNVQDASSTHVLISRRDSYITLHNALWDMSKSYDDASSLTEIKRPVDLRHPLGSYKLVNKNTEAVQAPTSLTYSHEGTHFFAGISSSIAIFDLQRFDRPIINIATIPSARTKLKGGGRGFKGHITALSLSPSSSASSSGLLAAGSLTRYIGLYDARSGEESTHFALPGTFNGRKVYNEALKDSNGDGISHLKWSPCGTYLYAAERKSDILLIYDARNVSLALGHCAGRKALSKQKMGFDVWSPGASAAAATNTISHEIWAGGTDGSVRVWRDPWAREGAVLPDEVLSVRDEVVSVTSTLVHPSGGMVVAACGVLGVLEYDDEDDGAGGGGVKGNTWGGVERPRMREWGCLEVFGFGGA